MRQSEKREGGLVLATVVMLMLFVVTAAVRAYWAGWIT